MVQKPRIRFIGGGLNSSVGLTHVMATRLDNRWTLCSSYFSRDHECNHRSHESYGIANHLPGLRLRDFLSSTIDSTDLYVILAPSPDHFDIMTEIANLGGSFLCEKSVVCDLDQCAKIRQTLGQAQGRYFAVHNFSGYAMIRKMRELIAQDHIGKIYHFDCEFLVDSFIQDPAGTSMPSWRKKDTSIPAVILDLGPHVHHLSDYLVGQNIVSARSRLCSLANSMGLIDFAEITGEYDSGSALSLRMSRAHAGKKVHVRVQVHGSHGSMTWQHDRCDELQIYQRGQGHRTLTRSDLTDKHRIKPGNPTGHIESFANFYDGLHEIIGQRQTNAHILPMESALRGIEFFAQAVANASVQS